MATQSREAAKARGTATATLYESRPAPYPGSDRGRTQQFGDGSGSVPHEEAQELHNFGAKPAAHFSANDYEAASPGMAELRIRVVALAPEDGDVMSTRRALTCTTTCRSYWTFALLMMLSFSLHLRGMQRG